MPRDILRPQDVIKQFQCYARYDAPLIFHGNFYVNQQISQ